MRREYLVVLIRVSNSTTSYELQNKLQIFLIQARIGPVILHKGEN